MYLLAFPCKLLEPDGRKKETGAFFCGRVKVGKSGGLEKDQQRNWRSGRQWEHQRQAGSLMGLCPRKAGLSLGPRLVPPRPRSGHTTLPTPTCPQLPMNGNPTHTPLRLPGLKSSAVNKWTPPCKRLQMPASQGTPDPNAPLFGVGGVDTHVKIGVVNRCMPGSYF